MKKQSCADRIRTALDSIGMTQTELSKKTGIPKSAISQYIKGSFEPKQDRIYLIAKALHVSEAWLMGFDVPMNEPKAENKSTVTFSPVTDDDIKFALFGGDEEITDEMYEEVKSFAEYVKQKYKKGTDST